MDFHEAANIFPLDEEHLDSLAADIRERGQEELIKTVEGKILDGRRRFLACQRAGVTPKFQAVEVADPIAYVLSLNLHRRHLDPSQQAMVGGRVREWYDKQARERMSAGGGDKKSAKAKSGVENFPHPIADTGKARDKAAAAVGVSGKSVDAATKVLASRNPDLIAAVDGGGMAVSKAAKIAVLPSEVQASELKAHRLDEPRPNTQEGQLLVHLRKAGEYGSTRDEASEALGIKGNALRPRWATLIEKGLIRNTGRMRLNSNGRKVEIFQATNRGAGPQEARNGTALEDNGKPHPRSVAIDRANDAINVLRRIPRDDPKRGRGFQIVRDWMKHNL